MRQFPVQWRKMKHVFPSHLSVKRLMNVHRIVKMQMVSKNKFKPLFCLIMRFPDSRVRNAVPFRTISTIVLKALADSLSVGEMKFPAALFTTTLGNDHSASILSSASEMASGFRMSHEIGRTGFLVMAVISAAVASRTGRRLLKKKGYKCFYDAVMGRPIKWFDCLSVLLIKRYSKFH